MAKDVYQLLSEDHRSVIALVERLEATDRPWERHRLLEEISLELIPHAMAEEAVFYPRLDDVERGAEERETSEDEHARVEELITELHRVADERQGFAERLAEMKNALLDHIDREELLLFEMAREILDEVEAVRLAAELSEAKHEVRERLVRAAERARIDRLSQRGP